MPAVQHGQACHVVDVCGTLCRSHASVLSCPLCLAPGLPSLACRMVEEIHLEGGTILGTSRGLPNVAGIVKRLGGHARLDRQGVGPAPKC